MPFAWQESGESSCSFAAASAAVLRTYGSASFIVRVSGSTRYSATCGSGIELIVRIASALMIDWSWFSASFKNAFTASIDDSGCYLAYVIRYR